MSLNELEQVYGYATNLAEAIAETRASIGEELIMVGDAIDEICEIVYGEDADE